MITIIIQLMEIIANYLNSISTSIHVLSGICINYLRFIDSTQGEKKESPESHDPLRYFLQQQLSLLRQHTVYLTGAVGEEDGAYRLRTESLARTVH